jgi:predicted lipoprotein
VLTVHRRVLSALFVFLAVAGARADSAIPLGDIVTAAIDAYIRPNFLAFAESAKSLDGTVADLCRTPSADAVKVAQVGFRKVVLDYSRVEFLRLGPLGVADRAERLLFWPDAKGIALKQVQQVLGQQDATATDPATLQKKSVALQGLGGLEYALFGTGSESLASSEGAFRCAYAASVATLVSGLAAVVNAEWQDDAAGGVVDRMRHPRDDAADFRSAKEVVEKLAGSLIVGTESIRDQRLMPVIGAASGAPKPRSALFWRSGMTLPALKAGFEGMRDFFIAARFPDAVKFIANSLTSGIDFEFGTAVKTLAVIDAPIDVAVTRPDDLTKLKYLVGVTRSLDVLLGETLPGALGLTPGFSLLDGD